MHDATLGQFGLALLVLWLLMEYVPEGIYVGAAVLLVTFLSSEGASQGVSNLFGFIQSGVSRI